MLEFIGAMFVFGTIGWWVFFGLLWFILMILAEGERAGWSWILVIAFIAGMEFIGDAQIISTFTSNIPKYLMYFALFFVIGIVWAYIKFSLKMMVVKKAGEAAEIAWNEIPEDDNRKKNKSEDKIEELKSAYITNRMDAANAYKGRDLSKYRKSIVTWITCWPPSVLWTLLDDPIRKLGRWIYDAALENSFRGIMKKSLGKYAE